MPVLFLVLGAMVGAWLGEASGAILGLVVGGALGYSMAELRRARSAVTMVEAELRAVRRELAALGGRAPEAPEPLRAPLATPVGVSAPAMPPAAAPAPRPEPPPPRVAVRPGPLQPAAGTGGAAAPALDDVILQSRLVRVIRDWFMGGNTIVRVGVVVLFFGVAFLLRYVAERTRVPIEFRLTGVALGALALLAVGWRLRLKRPGFALAIQGGAVGILYLTVFAALRLYGLLPAGGAFALLLLIVGFSAALAVLQDSLALAALGTVGGFVAPILASTGEGSHVVLFSYYAVLNLGILAIAWFKAWRLLNLLGFLFTYVIATAWGVLRYRSELFWSTEPFLVGFFLLFTALAVLHAFRQAPDLRRYLDTTLIFGTPLVTAALQAAMLREQRYAMALSALAEGGIYVVLARVLFRARPDALRLLVESFLALGVAFLTLAVPLALDGGWTAATWALEGAALAWIGCRTGRVLARAGGALLLLAAGVTWLVNVDAATGSWPVVNGRCLGGVLVAAAAVFASAYLERYRSRIRPLESAVGVLLFWWGLLFWLRAGLGDIDRFVASEYRLATALGFIAVSALASSALNRVAALSHARLPPLLLLPAMIFMAIAAFDEFAHPLASGGWAAWPAAFAVFYYCCRHHEGPAGGRLGAALHVAALWLLAALLTAECRFVVAEFIGDRFSGIGVTWRAAAWVLVPAAFVLALPALAARVRWPFAAHRQALLTVASGGFAAYGIVWLLIANAAVNGDSQPLAYLPLLNPLDLATALTLLAVARAWGSARQAGHVAWPPGRALLGFAALAFIWANAMLLRSVHQWAGVPFEPDSLMRSTVVQTCLSIFWAVLSLTTMALATRRGTRAAWLAGAGLLAVVVVKLFLVDLSRVGTVERIVSFVGVGLLMLLVGYLSPVPPAPAKRELGQGEAA